jgi:hypothetical protein
MYSDELCGAAGQLAADCRPQNGDSPENCFVNQEILK